MLSKDSEGLKFVFSIGNGVITTPTSQKHFKGACKRAGVDLRGRPQYSLRHTFNTELMSVASLEDVQESMGHRSMSSTLTYLHSQPDHLFQKVGHLKQTLDNLFE